MTVPAPPLELPDRTGHHLVGVLAVLPRVPVAGEFGVGSGEVVESFEDASARAVWAVAPPGACFDTHLERVATVLAPPDDLDC